MDYRRQRTQVIVTFLLGILILKEKFTILQLIISGILVTLSIIIARDKKNDEEEINKKAKQKVIMYSCGVVLFYGISDFINKIYITEYQSPLYVMFNYAIIIVIGIFAYCLITKNWNYIDIRKIKNKGYFVLQNEWYITKDIKEWCYKDKESNKIVIDFLRKDGLLKWRSICRIYEKNLKLYLIILIYL